MSTVIIATAFAVVFLAELPDKTALASLVLATRYPARYVFLGAAGGFTVQVALALLAGSALGLLPHRTLQAIVAALFLLGAVLLLRHGREEPAESELPEPRPERGAGRVVLTSFSVITVAEFGDLTQIVTANLAARYDWLSVGIGSLAALWCVAFLAILGGQGLLRLVPLHVVTRVAAAVMAALAVLALVSAVRG